MENFYLSTNSSESIVTSSELVNEIGSDPGALRKALHNLSPYQRARLVVSGYSMRYHSGTVIEKKSGPERPGFAEKLPVDMERVEREHSNKALRKVLHTKHVRAEARRMNPGLKLNSAFALQAYETFSAAKLSKKTSLISSELIIATCYMLSYGKQILRGNLRTDLLDLVCDNIQKLSDEEFIKIAPTALYLLADPKGPHANDFDRLSSVKSLMQHTSNLLVTSPERFTDLSLLLIPGLPAYRGQKLGDKQPLQLAHPSGSFLFVSALLSSPHLNTLLPAVVSAASSLAQKALTAEHSNLVPLAILIDALKGLDRACANANVRADIVNLATCILESSYSKLSSNLRNIHENDHAALRKISNDILLKSGDASAFDIAELLSCAARLPNVPEKCEQLVRVSCSLLENLDLNDETILTVVNALAALPNSVVDKGMGLKGEEKLNELVKGVLNRNADIDTEILGKLEWVAAK